MNLASRMESHGISGRIQVRQARSELLRKRFSFEEGRSIDVKGKGAMTAYVVKGLKG